jgi:hypothetical protein
MNEILPGLWHWTTQHPNIGQAVSSYYLSDTGVLLDPMVPEEGLSAFDELPPPKHVVLSSRHHDRDHAEFVETYGCSFHVNEHGVHEYEGEEVAPYAIGDEPVPGLRAIAHGPIAPDDTILRVDAGEGALCFADSLLRDEEGELAFMPDSLLGDDPEQVRADITGALEGLLSESFDHLLFAHGEPVVGGGRQLLERFVSERR